MTKPVSRTAIGVAYAASVASMLSLIEGTNGLQRDGVATLYVVATPLTVMFLSALVSLGYWARRDAPLPRLLPRPDRLELAACFVGVSGFLFVLGAVAFRANVNVATEALLQLTGLVGSVSGNVLGDRLRRRRAQEREADRDL